MVRAQVQREQQRQAVSREDFLASLNVRMTLFAVGDAAHRRFPRLFELINKTNQFNTTGRRWTREECTAAFSAGIKFYAFEVTDQYTEYGLVGVLVVDATGIQQFVMSCRIMGLEAEAAAIAQITTIFADDGAENIFAAMVETDRNLPCREVYSNLGFVETTGGWQRATTPPLATPAHITMNVEEGTDVVAEVAA
jgi:FkbH-like protein